MSGRNPRGGDRGRGHSRGRGSSDADFQSLPFRSQEPRRGDRASRGRGRGQSTFGTSNTDDVFTPAHVATHNETVNTTEDHLLSLLKQDKSADLPNRPGYGQRGRPVLLWANYFNFAADTSIIFQRYSVTAEANGTTRALPGRLNGRIIKLLIEQLSTAGHRVVSDFRATLISGAEIDVPEDGFLIAYRAEGEDTPEPDARTYAVRLKHNGTLPLATLLDYTTSTNVSSFFGTKQELIQALNLVIGQHPKSQAATFSVGRNHYVSSNAGPSDRASLGGGIQALRAFVFSVRAATERILINVQLKNLPFYEPGPLDQLARSYMAHNGSIRLLLAKFLKLLSVEVMHIRRTNSAGQRMPRYKTIFGLATQRDGRDLPNPPRVPVYGAGAKEVQFFLQSDKTSESSIPSGSGKKKHGAAGKSESSGRYISVFDFFRAYHNITIKDVDLPVVNVGNAERPSYLPMQVCEVRPGQSMKGRITPEQTKQMIRFAVRRPAQNATSITTTGLELLGVGGGTGNPYLDAFKLTIDPRMITVPGRVLMPPTISYASGQTTKPFSGNWNLGGSRMLHNATLDKWTYLLISMEGRSMVWPTPADFNDCLGRFAAKLKAMGIRIAPHMAGIHISITPGDPELKIDNALQKFANHPSNRPQMILVVIPASDATSVYNRVKYICDIRLGLISQCLVDTKLVKANDQYFGNVGLKVNLKLGGCNHAVSASDLGVISPKDTMFVGIDVTHPSPGSSSIAPSIAGVVSSVDERLAQWPADIRIQEARKEMVDTLDEMLQGCLRRWQKRNRSLPRTVIVYRDGVSESQYQMVLDHELPALRKATAAIYPATDTKNNIPRLAIVVVGKRHHTRFYATNQKDADRAGNPQNGTVVDRGVTEVANWDFFLQAHTAIQGTAKPAHYYVIYDDVFRKEKLASSLTAADVLEQLSHSMCYLFGRATKAVSVCPPAYYADLVCERARCYLAHVFAPTPPTSSAVSMTSAYAGQAQGYAERVRIHERLRDVMFYI